MTFRTLPRHGEDDPPAPAAPAMPAEPAPSTAPAEPAPPDEQDLELMLAIRHFELRLLDLFEQGVLNGTTHTCLGQEYIPVALQPLLRDDDFVFSNHRGHGHYLARFADQEGLLAEIMGRDGAVCGGVGGSQHIFRGSYLSTGVQGESLPAAVGVALHFRRVGRGNLALAYIGDGTWGEGAVYEALNMAQLWRVPLLVVVENNEIAQSTPRSAHMAGTIAGRAAAFGIRYAHVGGCDVAAIRARLRPLIDDLRREPAPLVVEFTTQRLGPHSKGDDSRPAAEIRAAAGQDWYELLAGRHPDLFRRLDRAARRRAAQLAEAVAARPPSAPPRCARLPSARTRS
jgi:TPP-dependent pyruvate/acetoin dehydrogenase alpha subunit